ncbi:type II toxin-antitoxin system MqsA family antitoxin [Candidatus Curtissbacteria bacterium]|nr:type II toxin-antitoxin system MqsA family antitoxin [Candidatus Curtissbacteria bacterium]
MNVDFRWKDKLFVVKNVPVEVCNQCGEKYYSAEISKKLDDFVKKQSESKIRPQNTIQVPVFNWQ